MPPTIKRISKHLRRKGYSESHSIAIAVNAVKKGARSGDLNFPGVQQMGAKGRARYTKAYASWLSKRARAKAK